MTPTREPSQPTADAGNALEVLQHEVQRKLGRCMIRLQQYERMLKAMVTTMALEGPPEQLQALRQRHEASARNKTLGTLVGMFTGGYLTATSSDVETGEHEDGRGKEPPPDTAWANIRFAIAMSPEQHAQTKEGLAELVTLRNDLVHHFLERFDISQEHGCRIASSHLDSCSEKIDGHCVLLKNWAKGLVEVQALASSYVQSKAIEDAVVHGINPDGSVCWSRSSIVECLREAETACQVDSWTSLDAALRFISREHPDQIPSRYGCKTWRQVLKKSGLFEVRNGACSDGAIWHAWYRSCANATASQGRSST